ncbi:MAG: hypothetical protein GX222_01295 [Ruminococcaceae bacterium]|nr:hypothetical protein [Oscillospiraceae bacterium]
MNESGKTAILEALAKSNYFEDDPNFSYNISHDYPRKQKKRVDKSGEIPVAIELEYAVGKALSETIEDDLDIKLEKNTFSATYKYDNKRTWNINWVNTKDFINLYNRTFDKQIDGTRLSGDPIMMQLKEINGGRNFNHYRPANYFAKNISEISLSRKTLDNFENLFKVVNKLL